jgi:hypothetical protein
MTSRREEREEKGKRYEKKNGGKTTSNVKKIK